VYEARTADRRVASTSVTDHSNGLPPDEGTPPEDRVPDLHLDRLEALARRAPRDLARAADEAIARRAPALAPSRLRRRFRRRTVALLSLLGLMALAASAWAVLRETTILRTAMEAQLSERFGGEVTIGSVRWDGWNTIDARDLELRARGWDREAGRVASMRRATVVFSPWSLLLGRVELVDMEVDGLTVRLVELEDQPGEYAFLALRPTAGGNGGGFRQPSRALLRDLRLEFATARSGRVTPSLDMRFDADFAHQAGDASRYEFELREAERNGQPVPEGIRLKGTWDEQVFGYEATIEGLDIGPTLLRALPVKARRWAIRSGLTGRLERARIAGSPERPLREADLELRGVSFRERDAVRELEWGRIEAGKVTPIRGDLSVSLGEATARVRGRELTVEARSASLQPGEPGASTMAVPLELRLSTELLAIGGSAEQVDDEDSWLGRWLAAVPFSLELRARGLDARPTADGSVRYVELPMEAAEALARIGVRDWAADVETTIRRGPRAAGAQAAGARIEVTAALTLHAGTIESPEVPYRLRDVSGRVALRDGRIEIRGLSGRGAGRTALAVDGDLDIEGDDPGYSFRMRGTDVLLDRALVGAFQGAPSRIFGALLDDEAWTSLRKAGVLDDASQPGGNLDLELEVRHARGGGERVEVTGRIDLKGVRMVLDAFPYPMVATGRLAVLDERVDFLDDGVTLLTHGGGRGALRGHLELPRVNDRRLVRSYLEFSVEGERVNPALLAAIPPSFEDPRTRPQGWPGATLAPISSILRELGLDGRLSATGTVRTRPDESDAVTVNAKVSEGAIRPTARLAAVLRENGLSWPGRTTLDDVRGTIIADSERVQVLGATATHGTGIVRAQGGFDPEDGDGTLSIEVERFPLERDLVLVADGPATESALQAWDALSPTGTIDAEVAWMRDARGQDTYAHVRPTALTLAGTVALEPVCGDLFYRNGVLSIDSVDLRGADADDTPLRIEAHGTINGPSPAFEASVETMAIQSPLVSSVARAFGASVAEEAIRELRMTGALDARVALPGTGGAPWEVSIEPSWVRGERDEHAFEVRRDAGRLVAGPAGLRVDGFAASIDRGTVRIDGALSPTSSSALAGELTVDALVSGYSDALRALVPPNARRALESVDFAASGPVFTRGMRTLVDIPRSGPDRVSLVGDLGIADASLRAGVDLDRIDGSLAFDLTAIAGEPVGTIGMQLDQLRAMGRRATGIAGSFIFASDAGLVRLEDLTASLYGGRVTGRAAFDPVGGWEAHVTCANVGFGRFVDADGGTGAADAEGEGLLRGRIDIRGEALSSGTRRGSGRVAVQDARMMEFPLGLSVLQLTQLMLPLNAAMERASARFDIDDTRILVRELDLSCGTLRLEGSGEVRTGDGALALRMRNRGTVPLLSDLYGVVTDQVFAIDVGGTLSDPRPRLAPIPVLAPSPEPGQDGAPTRTPEHDTGSTPRSQ
jgi:hypothetical protein